MTNPAAGNGLFPLSFGSCVSNEEVLRANLLASPCLGPDSPHEVILVKNCPSAADGLNLGYRAGQARMGRLRAPGRLLARWLGSACWRPAPRGRAAVRADRGRGVYGVGEVIAPQSPGSPLAAERIGWVVDRGRLLRDGPELPARVATLDELLLVLPRDTPLRFDPALGFHLYGADICLQARERGLAVVALGALCHHNSRSVGLPEAFFASAEVFARKWRHRLPVATPCVVIDREGRVHLWATPRMGRDRSRYAEGSAGSTTAECGPEGPADDEGPTVDRR